MRPTNAGRDGRARKGVVRRMSGIALGVGLLWSAGCSDQSSDADTAADLDQEAVVLPSIEEDTRPTVTMAAAMPDSTEVDSIASDTSDPSDDTAASAPEPSSESASEIPPSESRDQPAESTNGVQVTGPASIYSGAYTSAQAARGARIVEADCSSCHNPRDWSRGEVLRGFAGRSVFDLVSHIRNTMPMDSPGRLTEQQYTDIVAYLFELNSVPAGPTELAAGREALEQYEVEYRP